MLPIKDDGCLGDPTELIEHDGTHIDSSDPPTPRPHAAVPGPENRFIYVPDLGLDEVVVYELDLERGRLSRASAVQMDSGTGPRHLVFHPDNQVAYVINEPDSSLTIFDRYARTGELNFVESVRTTPSAFDGENNCLRTVNSLKSVDLSTELRESSHNFSPIGITLPNKEGTGHPNITRDV